MDLSASTAKWNDLRAWSALIDGSACPICLAGQPLDVLAELASGWITMQEAAPERGYVCLVSRMYVIVLQDLRPRGAQAFMPPQPTSGASRQACRATPAARPAASSPWRRVVPPSPRP
jgi:hypothetical protein